MINHSCRLSSIRSFICPKKDELVKMTEDRQKGTFLLSSIFKLYLFAKSIQASSRRMVSKILLSPMAKRWRCYSVERSVFRSTWPCPVLIVSTVELASHLTGSHSICSCTDFHSYATAPSCSSRLQLKFGVYPISFPQFDGRVFPQWPPDNSHAYKQRGVCQGFGIQEGRQGNDLRATNFFRSSTRLRVQVAVRHSRRPWLQWTDRFAPCGLPSFYFGASSSEPDFGDLIIESCVHVWVWNTESP